MINWVKYFQNKDYLTYVANFKMFGHKKMEVSMVVMAQGPNMGPIDMEMAQEFPQFNFCNQNSNAVGIWFGKTMALEIRYLIVRPLVAKTF